MRRVIDECYPANNPSQTIAVRLAISRLLLWKHLATLVGAAFSAHPVGTHQRVAVRARHQRRWADDLIAAAVTAPMPRNLIFWQSSHGLFSRSLNLIDT